MKKLRRSSTVRKVSRIHLSCASHSGRRRFFAPEVVFVNGKRVEVRMLFPLPVGSHVELAASAADSASVGQAEVAHCRCGKGGLFEIGLLLKTQRAKSRAAARV